MNAQEVEIAWATFDVPTDRVDGAASYILFESDGSTPYKYPGNAYPSLINGTTTSAADVIVPPSGYFTSVGAGDWGMYATDPAGYNGFANKFVIRNIEGPGACYANGEQGNNDNLITIGPISVAGYKSFKITYEVEVRGVVDCEGYTSPVFSCNPGEDGRDQIFIGYSLDDTRTGSNVQYNNLIEQQVLYGCGNNDQIQTPAVCGNAEGKEKLIIYIRVGNQAIDEVYLIDNVKVIGIPDSAFEITSATLNTSTDVYEQNICTGGTSELTVSSTDADAVFTWTGPGVAANTTGNSITVDQTGTYTVTSTNSLGCMLTKEIVVTSNGVAPNAGTDGALSFCTGENLTQTDFEDSITGEDTGGEWTLNGSPVTFPVNTAGTYIYTVSNDCGSDTAEVVVTANSLPIPTAPALEAHYEMCQGQDLSLSNLQGLYDILTQYDITLTYDANGNGVLDAGENESVNLWLEDTTTTYQHLAGEIAGFNTQTGQYIVQVYDNDRGGSDTSPGDNDPNDPYTGCVYTTTTFLTVYDAEAGTISLPNYTICESDASTHTINIDGGFGDNVGTPYVFEDAQGNNVTDFRVRWESSDEDVITVDTDGTINIEGPGVAQVTYYVQNPVIPNQGLGILNPPIDCMEDASNTITITVTAQPIAGTISGDNEICEDETETYTITGNSATGTWSIVSSIPANIATINSTTGELTPSADGTVTIQYTVAGSGACSDVSTPTYEITINPLPTFFNNEIIYTP